MSIFPNINKHHNAQLHLGVFSRLHHDDEYEGTGMELALVEQII